MRDESVYLSLTEPERKVWDWLARHNINFDTQYRIPELGMTGERGSAIVDFIIRERNLVIRVQGSYWHRTLEGKSRDNLSRERMTGAGYQVVDILPENLSVEKIDDTMKLALQGQEAL